MSEPSWVPVRDLRIDALADGTDVEEAVLRVIRSGYVILGPEVSAFEEEFAKEVGADHAVGVASGTDALLLALRALGVGPGDRVVTVSHTAVATVAAIELAGAAPVFVDVDEATYTMTAESLADAVQKVVAEDGRPPAAVIVVHLYGQLADMPVIADVCGRHGMPLIEDAAQAHGAALGSTPVGSWGAATAFSFYPTKNLAALGDAGAVTTSDPVLADGVRTLRQYGWRERFISEQAGLNSRLDEMQAAVLRVRLRRLHGDNDRRREIAQSYDAALRGVRGPSVRAGARHVYHQYVVRNDARDAFRAHLDKRGVGTALHYPQPVHLQPAYLDRIPLVVPLPATELLAQQIVSLPMGPELTDAQVTQVTEALQAWSG